MSMTRDEILKAADLPTKAAEVPEWGATVCLGTMTGLQRDAWQEANTLPGGKPDIHNYQAKLLVQVIVDDAGERVFADDDAEALGAKNSNVLDRLYDIAARMNGLTDKDVEDAAKNLPSGQSAASSSDSVSS